MGLLRGTRPFQHPNAERIGWMRIDSIVGLLFEILAPGWQPLHRLPLREAEPFESLQASHSQFWRWQVINSWYSQCLPGAPSPAASFAPLLELKPDVVFQELSNPDQAAAAAKVAAEAGSAPGAQPTTRGPNLGGTGEAHYRAGAGVCGEAAAGKVVQCKGSCPGRLCG